MNTEIETSCDYCDDYGVCSETPCPYHPLKVGFVKDFCDALDNGRGKWGDLCYDDEMVRLASRSEEEIKIDVQKMASLDQKINDGLRSHVLDKVRKFHCVLINGKQVLKHKFNSKCTDFSLPGGCWAHEAGICRFIHPGEEKIYNFKKGERVLKLVGDQSPTLSSTPRSFSPPTFYSASHSPRSMITPSKEFTDCW